MKNGFALALAALVGAGCAGRCAIKPTDEVMLFPTYAYQEGEKKNWVAPVRGWIYEPPSDEKISRVVGMAQSFGGVAETAAQIARLAERIRPFLVETPEGRAIPVEIAGRDVVLDESNESGYFSTVVGIEGDLLVSPASGDEAPITYHTASCEDSPRFEGVVHQPARGALIVVSTLDAAVSDAGAGGRFAFVKNLLFADLRPVSGLPDAYRDWRREGAGFHYVSSLPWQFFPTFRDFLSREGFPAGSFEMRTIPVSAIQIRNIWETVAALLVSPYDFKRNSVETMVERFPDQRLILVGTMDDKDPEVFGDIARAWPDRIEAIHIRDVAGTAKEERDLRLAEAFRDVPPSTWHVFQTGSDLR